MGKAEWLPSGVEDIGIFSLLLVSFGANLGTPARSGVGVGQCLSHRGRLPSRSCCGVNGK